MKKILFGFVILFEINCFSQQLPQFTQFINNTTLFNPSMMGMQDDAAISVGGRWQMLGFGSEPRTAFISGQTRISNKSKKSLNPSLRISKDNIENDSVKQSRFSHYAGGQLLFDSYGAFNRTSLNGLYSMSIDLNPDWKLLAGLKFAYSNFGFDMTKAQVAQNTDIDQEYDSYIANGSNRNSFDLSAGFTLVSKNYFIGFAANQFTKTSMDLNTSNSYFDQRMHWNLITGYTYAIPGIADFQGMILMKKMAPTPLSIELALKAVLPNQLWVGVHFRNRASVGFMTGFIIDNKFQLGYSLDLNTNRLISLTNGGHELILSYRFGN
jgi:type IX secretion system PorP/SprF family membrane protein